MDEGTRYLVQELERLLPLPLVSKTDRRVWYRESKRVQKTLREWFPDLLYPHEVWHFLTDSDIRARDDGYRKYQEQIVRDYIVKAKG